MESKALIALCDHDFHILATCLARTINRDMELLSECREETNHAFMLELQIERLVLLMKLERMANRGGQGLQMYLTNPQEVYDNLCKERNSK